jgi:hypothetical protein
MSDKPLEITTAPPGTRPIRIPRRVELTDKGRLLSVLSTRAQRIEDVQRRLGWLQPRMIDAIEEAGERVRLYLIESGNCARYPVQGGEYSHITRNNRGGK